MKATNYGNNVQLASKLLKLNEARIEESKKQKKEQTLTEGGTPTTALTPDTDATRQMQQDMASAAAKGGTPAPVGAEPKPDHGETAMGTQNPQGEDEPVHDQPSEGGQQNGMTRPLDRRGNNYNAGPASPTQAEKGNLGNPATKTEADLTTLTGAELIEKFVELCGGLDEAIFALIAEGVKLEEAEAAFIDGADLSEGLIDQIKAKLQSKKAEPSAGYKQHLQKRAQTAGAAGKPTFVKSDKPAAAWKSMRREGPTARANK